MKKTVSMLLVIAALITLASCSKADEFVPAGYKKASNDKADHVLYVPEGWTVDMSTGVTTAYAKDRSSISFIGFELDDAIISFDPVISDTEGSEPPVSDTEEAEGTGETDGKEKIVTLEDYWKYYSEAFESTFSDMEYVTEGESTVVSGIEARKYVYNATVTGIKYRFLQVVAIKNKTVYVFTYTSRAENYEANIEQVSEMLGYLEIK